MSFAAIRAIANSSLMATSVQMQVTSANIANADVAGYTAKTATQSATVSGSLASGTSVTAISSDVDKYLLRELIAAASSLGAATVNDAKGDALQNLFGSTVGSDDDSGTSIASAIDSLQTSLTTLSGTVESSALGSLTVDALDSLASQLRETSSGIQNLRSDADGEIADAVSTVNDALDKIGDLNTQIVAAKTVAGELAALAISDEPEGAQPAEIAGPREEYLPDLAQLVVAKHGEQVKIEAVSHPDDPDDVLGKNGGLLPGPHATLAGPTFAEWLETN